MSSKFLLYKTDRCVNVLVDDFSKDFFKLRGVPFMSILEEKITYVANLEGELSSVVSVMKPDIVVTNIKDELKTVIVEPVNNNDVVTDASSVKMMETISLNEINGHVFFVLNSFGKECTYSQYLFIDQLKSLKSKLNID